MSQLPCIGHVHLNVQDGKRSRTFYQEILGLHLQEQIDSISFLSFGEAHHDIAINEIGSVRSMLSKEAIGLRHVAFEMPAMEQLEEIWHRLQRAGVPAQAVDHGISKALYFDDPDGIGIEIYVDTRSKTGHTNWEGMSVLFVPT